MSPSAIDAQEAEIQRERKEAERKAKEADEARQRALAVLGQGGTLQQPPPTGAGATSPEEQLQRQLRAERLKREAAAPYASSLVFAAKSTEAKTEATTAATPAQAQNESGDTGQFARASETQPAKPPRVTSVCDTEPSYDFETFCLPEGTIIESVLVNRLDSTYDGPVICQVSQDLYDLPSRRLLVPRGARVLGEAKQINSSFGQRVAVFFHVIVLPSLHGEPGKRISLDKFQGLDQVGESGLVSKINYHYVEIFGTSLALGAIGGLAQIGGYGNGGLSPWYGFRMGVTQQMAQSADRVLDKMLNKPATVIVKEGTRVKIITTADMRIPSYS
jgi:type IV secretion system protein VirB10